MAAPLFGEKVTGWPTRLRQRGQATAQGSGAQPQAAPPTQQQGRGRYNGQRIARSRLPEAAQRLGVSVEEAERVIRAEGGTIY